LVIALVIGIIVYGVYVTVIAPSGQLLSMVNGASITAADYREALRLYSSSQGSAEAPLLVLENNELVRQGAIAANISVTEGEIDQRIKDVLFPEEEEIDEVVYRQFLDTLQISESVFRQAIEVELLGEKLEDDIKGQVPEVGAFIPHVNVTAILVYTEEEAEEVMEKLGGGEDFASLAEGYGDGALGWLPRGIMSDEFDEVAFSTPRGNVSQPFSTAEGYYIIKVLEREDRALGEDVRGQLEANAFAYWLEGEREEKVDRKVDDGDLQKIYQWAMGQID
jgi:parvulin-like peptidyl-prolyl isomerase